MAKKDNKKHSFKFISSVTGLKEAFECAGIKKPTKFYREMESVVEQFPIAMSPYLFKRSLLSRAIYKQFIPDIAEIRDVLGAEDPLNEDSRKATDKLVHMYPDRALLLVTDICFSSCRFCTRKRIKKENEKISSKELNDARRYLARNKQIKDVIISGGDPLALSDSELENIIKSIKKIPSVKVLRIGTRTPISNPYRITDKLIGMLKKYKPLYVNIHINHPDEFTNESQLAIKKLLDAGMILGSQSVLLKGVNDNSNTLKELFYKCAENGIRPYYLYQCDEVTGTEHFWTKYQKMFEIANKLVGNMSGLAVPSFVFDCKGGCGKVRIVPDFYSKKDKKSITFKTFKNRSYKYNNLKN